jgi:hypothetical protein
MFSLLPFNFSKKKKKTYVKVKRQKRTTFLQYFPFLFLTIFSPTFSPFPFYPSKNKKEKKTCNQGMDIMTIVGYGIYFFQGGILEILFFYLIWDSILIKNIYFSITIDITC